MGCLFSEFPKASLPNSTILTSLALAAGVFWSIARAPEGGFEADLANVNN
jgi:hypothetical protein